MQENERRCALFLNLNLLYCCTTLQRINCKKVEKVTVTEFKMTSFFLQNKRGVISDSQSQPSIHRQQSGSSLYISATSQISVPALQFASGQKH